jgi:hypothetical protein
MIHFPETFIPIIPFHGYYFDIHTEKVYSIKIKGVLRELKAQKFAHYHFEYVRRSPYNFKIGCTFWSFSHNGKTHNVPLTYLRSIKGQTGDYYIPVHDRPKYVTKGDIRLMGVQ